MTESRVKSQTCGCLASALASLTPPSTASTLWFSLGAGGAEHAWPRAGSISGFQEEERGQEPGACEDKCHRAKGESLSPQEGRSSQLRGKDMPSDGWQKAIVTVGNGREYAAPHWGLVAPGMSDKRKEEKAQICKVCVHTGKDK